MLAAAAGTWITL